jgi:hypothetical protein
MLQNWAHPSGLLVPYDPLVHAEMHVAVVAGVAAAAGMGMPAPLAGKLVGAVVAKAHWGSAGTM